MSDNKPIYPPRHKAKTAEQWLNDSAQGRLEREEKVSESVAARRSIALDYDSLELVQTKVLPSLMAAKRNRHGHALRVSLSAYVRSLIDADLKARGLK